MIKFGLSFNRIALDEHVLLADLTTQRIRRRQDVEAEERRLLCPHRCRLRLLLRQLATREPTHEDGGLLRHHVPGEHTFSGRLVDWCPPSRTLVPRTGHRRHVPLLLGRNCLLDSLLSIFPREAA